MKYIYSSGSGILELKKQFHTLVQYLILLFVFTTPFPRGVHRPVAIILLIFWLLEGNFREKFKRMFHSRVFRAFILFLLFNYLAIFWSMSQPLNRNLEYVNGYLPYFAFVVIWTSIDRKFVPKIVTVFLFSMFINEIITYGIYLDFWQTARSLASSDGMPRAFIGHIEYSIFLSVTVLLLGTKIYMEKEKKQYFYILFFLFSLGNLLISGGRTGLVVLVFTVIVIIVSNVQKRLKTAAFAFLFFTTLFIVAYHTISIFHTRIDAALDDIKKIEEMDYNNSLGIRTALIQSSWEIIKREPLLGAGIYDNLYIRAPLSQNSDSRALHFIVDNEPVETNYHNSYLELITQTGIIGLGIFLYFIYTIARIDIKDPEYRIYKIITVCVLLSSTISSLTIHHSVPMALYSTLIALVLSREKIEKEVYA